MTNLSLKLQDGIYVETEAILSRLKKSRNAYINEALAYYNAVQKRQLLAVELENEIKPLSHLKKFCVKWSSSMTKFPEKCYL